MWHMVLGVLRRASLSLVLGGVTTIGVAWGLAAWLPNRGLNISSVRVDGPADDLLANFGGSLAIDQFKRPGMCRRQSYVLSSGCFIFNGDLAQDWNAMGPYGLGPPFSADRASMFELKDWGTTLVRAFLFMEHGAMRVSDQAAVIEDARGFPHLALWCRLSGSDPALAAPASTAPAGCFLLTPAGTRPGDVRALLYIPIWSGVFFNTLVFATLWLVVLYVPSVLNLIIRVARGYCLRCGYDLCHDLRSGCSECGWRRHNSPASTLPA